MKKYENFCSALQNLKDIYLYQETYDNVTMTGLAALQARNNVTHSYNRAVALDIIDQTKKHFYTLFCELKKTVDEDWIFNS